MTAPPSKRACGCGAGRSGPSGSRSTRLGLCRSRAGLGSSSMSRRWRWRDRPCDVTTEGCAPGRAASLQNSRTGFKSLRPCSTVNRPWSVPESHATVRRLKTRFDSWRGHRFDWILASVSGARRSSKPQGRVRLPGGGSVTHDVPDLRSSLAGARRDESNTGKFIVGELRIVVRPVRSSFRPRDEVRSFLGVAGAVILLESPRSLARTTRHGFKLQGWRHPRRGRLVRR